MSTNVKIRQFNRDFEYATVHNLSEPTGRVNKFCAAWKDGDYYYVLDEIDQAVYKYDSDFAYTDTSYDISGTVETPINLVSYAGKWYILGRVGENVDVVYEFSSSFVATGNSWTLEDVYVAMYLYRNSDCNYWYVAGVSSGGHSIIYRYDDSFTYTDDSNDLNSELSSNIIGIFRQKDYWYAFDEDGNIYQYDLSWDYTSTSYDISGDLDSDDITGIINVES